MDESKLYFCESHEWANIDGEVCTVGISAYAVEQLQDVVYLEIFPDNTVAKGTPFGIVDSTKSTNDLNSPVNGTIIERNQEALDDPAIVQDDPYEKGWLIKIKLTGTIDTSGLMNKAAYDEFCASH